MLYLYRCAGREGRAYPSIRHIAGIRKDCTKIPGCGVSRASVCRALAALEKLLVFIKLSCRSVCHRCNSYLLTNMVKKGGLTVPHALAQDDVQQVPVFPSGGSLKIDKCPMVNKITRVLHTQNKKMLCLLKTFFRRTAALFRSQPTSPASRIVHAGCAFSALVRPFQQAKYQSISSLAGGCAGARDPPCPGRGAQPLRVHSRGCP